MKTIAYRFVMIFSIALPWTLVGQMNMNNLDNLKNFIVDLVNQKDFKDEDLNMSQFTNFKEFIEEKSKNAISNLAILPTVKDLSSKVIVEVQSLLRDLSSLIGQLSSLENIGIKKKKFYYDLIEFKKRISRGLRALSFNNVLDSKFSSITNLETGMGWRFYNYVHDKMSDHPTVLKDDDMKKCCINLKILLDNFEKNTLPTVSKEEYLYVGVYILTIRLIRYFVLSKISTFSYITGHSKMAGVGLLGLGTFALGSYLRSLWKHRKTSITIPDNKN